MDEIIKTESAIEGELKLQEIRTQVYLLISEPIVTFRDDSSVENEVHMTIIINGYDMPCAIYSVPDEDMPEFSTDRGFHDIYRAGFEGSLEKVQALVRTRIRLDWQEFLKS